MGLKKGKRLRELPDFPFLEPEPARERVGEGREGREGREGEEIDGEGREGIEGKGEEEFPNLFNCCNTPCSSSSPFASSFSFLGVEGSSLPPLSPFPSSFSSSPSPPLFRGGCSNWIISIK